MEGVDHYGFGMKPSLAQDSHAATYYIFSLEPLKLNVWLLDIDLEISFDTVNHRILINQLYGIRGHILD